VLLLRDVRIKLCGDCVKRGTFSWSRRDKAAAFPAGTLCLGRRARATGVSGTSAELGEGDEMEGMRRGLPGVLGPDKNEPRERSGWVPVDVSAPFKAADIDVGGKIETTLV